MSFETIYPHDLWIFNNFHKDNFLLSHVIEIELMKKVQNNINFEASVKLIRIDLLDIAFWAPRHR